MPALLAPRWPILVAYPVSTLFYYALYHGLRPCDAKQRNWPDANWRLFRQNVCALVHSYALVLLLTIVLVVDGSELQRAGLRPFYSPLAYIAVGMSLGYMSMTLPWSLKMYLGTPQERASTRPTLIVHHAFVVLAELVYILTLTSPWYGSLSLVMFEVSNLFLMPHHLMTQLGYHGRLHFLNGLLFFVTCTFVRVLGCLVLGVVYAVDVLRYRDDGAGYGAGLHVALGLSLVSFWVILMLSAYWYWRDVLREVHKEFKQAFGEKYWLRCCACVRRCPPCLSACGVGPSSSTSSSRSSSTAGSSSSWHGAGPERA